MRNNDVLPTCGRPIIPVFMFSLLCHSERSEESLAPPGNQRLQEEFPLQISYWDGTAASATVRQHFRINEEADIAQCDRAGMRVSHWRSAYKCG
jgi:hypothetical protein